MKEGINDDIGHLFAEIVSYAGAIDAREKKHILNHSNSQSANPPIIQPRYAS